MSPLLFPWYIRRCQYLYLKIEYNRSLMEKKLIIFIIMMKAFYA